MTADLLTLIRGYGWHLAIVGLLGVFIVGWLKIPIKRLIDAKVSEAKAEKTFDTIAFVLGFVIAALLGCIYTLVADKCGWLYTLEENEKVLLQVGVLNYISNSIGAWSYQTIFYGIWKKLGLKRLLQLALSAIISLIKRIFDKNNDGTVDLDEAASIVTGLLKGGKLSIDEVLKTAIDVAPEVAEELVSTVTEEAGDAATVNITKDTEKLGEIAQTVISSIPQEQLSSLASALVEKAENKITEVASNPIEVSTTATVPEAPKRPTIKF